MEKKLHEEINERITKLGYKKVFIADKFGMSKQKLSYYLNGKRPIEKETEDEIRKFLGV